VLVIGYDEGVQAMGALIATGEMPARGRREDEPDITEGTQGLDEEAIARMLTGEAANVAHDCVALRELRASVRRRVPAATEKLNPRSHYLGYRVASRDGAYVYLQSRMLVVEADLPRTGAEEDVFRRAGLEVRHRNNFQGRAGWITGIRLPCSATPEQTALVADAIVRALTPEAPQDLF
jgi:hypothetical protein